jgi:hypothetical protein
MSTQKVANRLVELCRSGQYEAAQEELYSADAISIEPAGTPNEMTRGLEGILAKGLAWSEMVEAVHSVSVSDPVAAGTFFACTMINDVTFKGMGRQTIEEVCVYEVRDGKIASEQFFYPVMPQG